MTQGADPKREAILTAAFTQFSRYGFRRTSMEDIAKEMGISRASLYSYFKNKDEVFRGLSASIHQQTLDEAKAHLEGASDQADLISRVEAALVARLGRLQEIVVQSAHGSEICDETNRLCGDIVLDSSTRFHGMLTATIKAGGRAGEVDLKAAGLSAAAAADLVQLGASGLRKGAPDVASFRKRLRSFVRVIFAGLR